MGTLLQYFYSTTGSSQIQNMCCLEMFRPILFILWVISHSVSGQDRYEESLLIKPLEDGMVMAHFEFTTTSNIDIREINFGM